MRKDLNSGIRDIVDGRNTELCTDVVFARCSLVASQNSVGEVPALLSEVLDESSSFEVCLWDRNVKNGRPRGNINHDSHICALFGCCRAGQQRQ